eukprot:362538_1
MSFEEPIDDIKQADSSDSRYNAYDFQSISRAKVTSLLELIHNGTYEYNRDVTYKHLLKDGSLETVQMKHYPVTTSCPETCENPDEVSYGPAANYGSTTCEEVCIVYLCEYNDLYWG